MTRWKRRSRRFWICMTHRGEELFFHRYRLSKLGELDFQYSVICDIFCSFFKFSLHINPYALKRIEYQNNHNINPGYSFQAPKMLQHGELEKWTNHNFVLIFLQPIKNDCKINFSFQYSVFEVITSISVYKWSRGMDLTTKLA